PSDPAPRMLPPDKLPRQAGAISQHEGDAEVLPRPAVDLGRLGDDSLHVFDDPAFSQRLAHPWFDEPWFAHGDPNDPQRHIGLGQPLSGTSWRNRPIFFGMFVGGVMMDDL